MREGQGRVSERHRAERVRARDCETEGEGERERVLHAVTQMFAQYGCGKLQGKTGRE